MAQVFDQQVWDVQIYIAVVNGNTALVIPVTEVRVFCPGMGNLKRQKLFIAEPT